MEAQTLASFCTTRNRSAAVKRRISQQHAVPPDESSMVGNTDMARAYALLIAAGGVVVPWRAVTLTSCRPSHLASLSACSRMQRG